MQPEIIGEKEIFGCNQHLLSYCCSLHFEELIRLKKKPFGRTVVKVQKN